MMISRGVPLFSLLALLVVSFVLFSSNAPAQEQTGTLEGRVTDSTAAALPGVIVGVQSSALITGSRSLKTDSGGAYRFANLPVGTYEVTFESNGFTKEIHKDVQVHASTTFTVNTALKVTSASATVEVVGDAPVIETAQTDIDFTFTKQQMDTVPNARDPWAMLSQVPGVVTDTVNVGGTQTGNQPTFRGLGVDPTQNTYLLNGANVTDNTGNGGSQFYFDVDSFKEMQIQIDSHGADVQTPGMVMNIIPKSGTDAFHGDASGYFSSQGMETNNLDSALRRMGVTNGSNLHKYWDAGGDLGGPIWKQKVWFWGAYRYQSVGHLVTSTRTPDGGVPIDQVHLWYPSAQINWQISANDNFSFFFDMGQKQHSNVGLSALQPVPETWNQQGDPIARLFTFRNDYIASPRLVLSAKVFIMDQGFEYLPQPGINTATTPSGYDLATGVYSLAPPYLFGIAKSLRAGGVSGNYFGGRALGGLHEIKFGFDIDRYQVFGNQNGNGGTAYQTYPADTQLQFYNGKPSQVVLYAAGAQNVSDPTFDLYGQDGYRIHRLRIDLGLRYDRQANRLNAVTAPTSQWLPQVKQSPSKNLITWNTLAPRIGVLYDLTGKSKSLLKASYNRYYYQLWTNLAAATSTAGPRAYTYVWNDVNGDKQFENGEQGTRLSVVDPSATPVTVNPALKSTYTNEVTVGYSQEVMPTVALNVSYIYREDHNLTWQINPNITPSDYTPIQATDPGPNGVASAENTLIFYNLTAAKVGLSPNYLTTRPGFTQEYQGIQVEAIKRLTRGVQFIGSYNRGVQKENYGPGSYQNPQDIEELNGTRIPSSRPNIFKLIGSYQFRQHFLLSANYNFYSGPNYTRTVNSLNAGVKLNQGNVAILAGKRDLNSYASQNLLDVRGSYSLRLHDRYNVSFVVDAFNFLNINTIDSTQTLSGPHYGQVLDFIAPRLFRGGLKLAF